MASQTFDEDASKWLGMAVSEPPPGVTLSRATLADYQAVLDITPGFYRVFDTLPDRLYPEYAPDPNRYNYVLSRKRW